MRARRSLGSSGFIALLTLVGPVLVACSASGGERDAPPATEVAPTSPAPSQEAGKTSDGGAGAADGAPTPPKNECKLAALTGVADVSPEFVVYAPGALPAVMTGGTLKGEYVVDEATVFLPSGTAGLVDPRASTGTINAWAVFDGTNYRLYLKAAFSISTVAGPQAQGADSASQGAFRVSASALTLDHACDTAIAQEADYSFTDTGAGRATILIKTPSPYGDTYLQLQAAKN
jgi:hypothetical protein